MKIAVSGLGRMGSQIARKLHNGGHTVIVHNRSHEPIDELKALGALAAYEKDAVISAFGEDQVVLWLMLPSHVVESELALWLKLLPKGSILIDGGNSDFRVTQQRAAQVKDTGSTLVDIGTSGGVHGFVSGFSLMMGGDSQAYETIAPALETLAQPNGGYHHFGESGAGHYVKMVHNAIEYGMMESLAEGYRLLKEGPVAGLDVASAATLWQQQSIVASRLNEFAREILVENPELADISGVVAESGEARWALEVAQESGIAAPAIQAALEARQASQRGETNYASKLVAALRKAFGGHELPK
jgi:6-phosphogluconate dehydrogenase